MEEEDCGSCSHKEPDELVDWKELDLHKSLESVFQTHGLNRRNIKTIIHEIFKDKNVKKILQGQDDKSGGTLNLPKLPLTRSNLKLPENEELACTVDDNKVEETMTVHDFTEEEHKQGDNIIHDELNFEQINNNELVDDVGYNFEWQYFKDKFGELNFDEGDALQFDEDDIALDPDFNYLDAETPPDKEDYRSDFTVRVSKRELDDLINEISENTVTVEDPTTSTIKSSTPRKKQEPKKSEFIKRNKVGFLKHCAELLKAYFKTKSTMDRNAYLAKFPFLRNVLREIKQFSATSETSSINFTSAQRKLLQHQMQMHIQLLTQTNLLCRNNETFAAFEEESYQLVAEMDYFRAASKSNPSPFSADNLKASKILCEKSLPVSKAMKGMPKHLSKKGYLPITRALAKTIAYSKSFMYLDLLPLSAALDTSHMLVAFPFLPSEDSLLAIGLNELRNLLVDYVFLIHEIYLPTKSKKSIKNRIKNVMIQNEKETNPIKCFKLRGILPQQDTSINLENENDWKKPINCPHSKYLPYWLESLQYERNIQREKQGFYNKQKAYMPNTFIPILYQESPSGSGTDHSSSNTILLQHCTVNDCSTINTPTKSPIQKVQSLTPNENVKEWLDSCVPSSKSENDTITNKKHQRPILPKNNDSLTAVSLKNVETLRTDEKIKSSMDEKTTQENENLTTERNVDNHDSNIKKRKSSLKPSLRIKLFKTNNGHIVENLSKEQLDMAVHDHAKENSSELVELEEDMNNLLAQSYIQQVQEYFHDAPEKVSTFLDILNRFSLNNECVVTLYHHLSKLFNENDELLHGFIPFLLPNQALECGVYKDYFVFNNAKKFLYKLKGSLSNETEQFQKILEILNDSLSEVEIKDAMLPILAGNDELLNLFLMFFDNESVPESFCGGKYEEIYLNDSNKHDNMFEEINIIARVRHHAKHKRNIESPVDVPDHINDLSLTEDHKENEKDIHFIESVDSDDQIDEVLSNVEDNTDHMSDSEPDFLDDDVDRISPPTLDKDYLMDDHEDDLISDCSEDGSVNDEPLSLESDLSNQSFVDIDFCDNPETEIWSEDIVK